MTTIPTQKQLIKKLIGICFGFALVISTGYIWAIPALNKNYKTYNLLIIGVIGAATCAGYETYRNFGAESQKAKRITFSILLGVAIAILVLFISLLAILNIKGT